MARPYISIGRGGPRVGVVLGPRAVLGMGKFFVITAAIIAAMAALAYGASFSTGAQWAIVAIGALAMFRLARRPYVPPMTAAERERRTFKRRKQSLTEANPSTIHLKKLP